MDIYYHPDQTLHHPRTYFSRGKMREPQEVPGRITHLLDTVRELGHAVHQPALCDQAALEAVHTPAYLAFLKTAHARWKQMPADWGDEVISTIFVREPNALRGILGEAAAYLADGSCPIGEHTWRSAHAAASCAVAAARRIDAGARSSYALCRPPGHHARAAAAGGFCYLNNAAIAATTLRERHARVVVLDTDMHHGQGIQEIFYDRDDVCYVSVHADPTNFYPATAGFADECGRGAGEGCNLNLPMPHGSPESVFFDRLADALAAVRSWQPDAVVLSLGFDIYHEDPQSQVAVTTAGFGRLGEAVAGLDLPTVIVQEGGYDVGNLGRNVTAFLAGFGA